MAKNNKTRFFYVSYSDKTWVFDQSERAQSPIYIIKENEDVVVVCSVTFIYDSFYHFVEIILETKSVHTPYNSPGRP